MEETLLKSHFVGRDGFRWWVGQIPPTNSKIEEQTNGGGVGNRYKVRIMGYHSYNTTELSDEDLPWANIILPPGVGTGGGGAAKSVKFAPGDTVLGFFLDGDNAQLPVIFGAFGRSIYAATDGKKLPFQSFTGHTGKNKKPPASVTRKGESNDANAQAQKPNQHLSPADAKKVDAAAYSSMDGAIIPLPCAESGSKKTIQEIKDAIQQFVKDVQNIKIMLDGGISYVQDWIKTEIDLRAIQLQKLASGVISGMVNYVFQKLIPVLKKGLDALYNAVYAAVLAAGLGPAVAHEAGVAAQELMIPPVKVLQDLIPCMINTIISALLEPIKKILKSVADNVLNFVQCVGDQTVGAVVNLIVDGIVGGMLPALDGIKGILKFVENFNVEDLMRNGAGALLGMIGIISCNKSLEKDKYGACKYRVGYGPIKQDGLDLKKIIDNANTAKAISTASILKGDPLDEIQKIAGSLDIFDKNLKLPNFQSKLGKCYSGPPTLCSPPVVNIFGGEGEGAKAIPLFGLSITGKNGKKTGSVIGFKVTDSGSGYVYPPFVEVVDNCEQGYGATATAVLDKNGKVKYIYSIETGANFPVDGETDYKYTVKETYIPEVGTQYSKEDKVIDNLGNKYKAKIVNGSITQVTPINKNIQFVNEAPEISVESETGFGAIIIPILEPVTTPEELKSGDVQSVIDCIT